MRVLVALTSLLAVHALPRPRVARPLPLAPTRGGSEAAEAPSLLPSANATALAHTWSPDDTVHIMQTRGPASERVAF